MTDKKRKAKKSKKSTLTQRQAQRQEVHIHLDKPKRRTTRKKAQAPAREPAQAPRITINPMFAFQDMKPPASLNYIPFSNPQELVGMPPMGSQVIQPSQVMRQPTTEQPSTEIQDYREIMKFLQERYPESKQPEAAQDTPTFPALPALPEPEPETEPETQPEPKGKEPAQPRPKKESKPKEKTLKNKKPSEILKYILKQYNNNSRIPAKSTLTNSGVSKTIADSLRILAEDIINKKRDYKTEIENLRRTEMASGSTDT